MGLSSEIFPLPNGEERLKEAAHHDVRRMIMPKTVSPSGGNLREGF